MMMTKPMLSLFSEHPFILSEAAICERLRGNDAITLHPTLFNTPLIYDESAAKLLASITHQYIDIAREFAVPIIIAAPTWRLDAQRVAGADVPPTINRDAVEFVKKIKADSGYELVYLSGIDGTKNDCYDPAAALSVLEAEQFHAAQAQQLASTGLDFLLAQTMPAVTEAEGMARAMIASGLPAVISFCINRDGRVLDGTPLDEAIDLLDDRLEGAPLGYAVNCSHPTFIKAEQMNPHALSRLARHLGQRISSDRARGAGTPRANR